MFFFIGREEKLKIMNTHSGGGSADKNEKTTLLREITYLTRLIQQHDYKNKAASRLDVSVRTQTPKNKCLNIHQLNPSGASYGGSIQINRLNYSNVQTSSRHGAQQMSLPASHSVFVNPKKLNCQLLEANHAAERIQKQNNIAAVDIEYMPHRVYINPNFKKKVSPTNKPVFKFVAGHVTSPSILGTVNKKIYINREANFGSKNIVHQYVESVLPANSINKNPDGYRIRKSQKAVSNVNPEQLNKTMSYKKHSLSNSCLTHICRDNQVNIVDQKPQNLARKVMFHNTEPKVVQKSENTDMSQTSDGSISLCRHPVEFESRTITSTEKIPFQKHEPPKTDSVTPEHYTSVYSLQESSKHSELVLGKETVSKICNPKSNGNNIKKSSGLCASIQPQKIRDMNCHRRRSSSTCLVAVSKTKLVRKRKLDINGMDTESNKGIPVQKKKLMKLLQPANRYKLNKIGTVTIKNITPNAYSVNNNPFRLVKLKPGIKVLPGKANSHNGDRFKLVRLKTSANSSSSNKFKLVLAQKNVKQAHCPVENVTLVQSKLPGKSIKSKRVIKKGLESAVDIQGKKGIQLTKDARNKWFSAGNTAMLLTKKTKLPRANKFKNEINNKMKRTPPGSELMAVSRTKLVRKPVSEITRIQKLKTAEYRNEIKLTHSVKLAHRVKNKYKFIRNQLNTINTVQHVNPRCQVLQNTLRMQSMLKKRIASRILKKRCSLIKIGDAYYRASYNKLTRRTPVRATGHCDSVKVQGKKFILQRGRQSLKYFRVTPLRLSKLKNGSCNVRPKIGTPNTPFSRLIQAKQRSIALLTNRLRKNNQPCLMFNRFGRCAGKDKGTCNKLHDPKNIAICKRFVQGCCENPSCLLSHNVGPEKMPTCHHFLAGNCVRENCPYLHVKLSKKAPICIAFLQGYCADAANCQKRHEHTCPEFEEKGVCPKGKYCPYPHPKEKINHCRSSEQCKTSIETCMKNNVEEYEEKTKNAYEEETKNVVSSCRYFEEATAGEFPSAECIEESMFEEGAVCINDESSNCWINKRPKIGNLPGYIPLMNNSVEKIT